MEHKLHLFYVVHNIKMQTCIEHNKRVVSIALAVNVFYLAVCLFWGNFSYFGVADDYFMARTLEGVFGDSYNVHLTFVNVLYGYFLLPLYHLFPKVGWYYVGEIAEVFVSLTAISFVVLKKMGARWGVLLSLLFILFFARDFYLTAQFTQCAAILGAAGMLLIAYGINAVNNKKRLFFCGCILIVLGTIMRREAVLMGIPFFACALLVQIKACFRNKILLVVSLLALYVGFCGLEKFNQFHYASPEYQKYMSFQSPRVTLGDKTNYEKDLVCDELEERNFLCEDYRLLNRWTFYDTEVFTIDTLRSIAGVVNKYSYPVQWRTMPKAVLDWFDRSLEKPGLWAFLLFSALMFISKGGDAGYTWGSLFILLSLMAYLLYRQRLVYRVESGLWLYATVLSIPFIGKMRQMPIKVYYVVVGIALIAICSFFAYSGTFVRSTKNGNLWDVAQRTKYILPEHKALFDYVQSMPENTVFFANMNSYMTLTNYRNLPYLSEPIGSWKKIAPLGYWTPYFPDIENHLKNVGMSNPIHDLVLDNVFVINEDGLVDFLQNHYYDSVDVQIVRNFADIKILKYSVVESSSSKNTNVDE